MNRRFRVVLIISLALIAGLALWTALRPREPVYQGKPVSFWFKKYVFSFSPAREEALETIAEIGPDAVPYLARMLKKNDSPIARAYRSLRPKLPATVQRWLPQPVEPKRLHADAIQCLGRLGWSFTTPVGPLVEATKHPDAETRKEALNGLMQIGPRTAEIVVAFAAALGDRNAEVRGAALVHVWGLSVRTPKKEILKPALPALTTALKDPTWQHRKHAARALMNLGSGAKQAVPSLLEIFKHSEEDKELAWEAANALMRIDATLAGAVVPFVVSELTSLESGKVQDLTLIFHSAEALASAGPLAKPAVAALTRLLKHPDSAVVQQTAVAFAKMGALAAQAIPALRELLTAPDDWTRLSAAQALTQIDPAAAKAGLPVMLECFKSGGELRMLSAWALQGMGSQAAEAIPLLEAALSDPTVHVTMNIEAGEVLRQIAPDQAPRIVATYEGILDRRDLSAFDRLRLVQSLGEMREAARPALGILAEHLKHRDRKTQLAAAEALLKIDENQTSVVVAFLIDYLQKTDQWDRERAAEMLGELGRKAKAAVAALRQAAQDADAKVREKAREALRKIED